MISLSKTLQLQLKKSIQVSKAAVSFAFNLIIYVFLTSQTT